MRERERKGARVSMHAFDEKASEAGLTFILLVKKALTHFNSIQASEGTNGEGRAVGKYAGFS